MLKLPNSLLGVRFGACRPQELLPLVNFVFARVWNQWMVCYHKPSGPASRCL